MKRWMIFAIFMIVGMATIVGPRLMAATPGTQTEQAVKPSPNAALRYFRAFLLMPRYRYFPTVVASRGFP